MEYTHGTDHKGSGISIHIWGFTRWLVGYGGGIYGWSWSVLLEVKDVVDMLFDVQSSFAGTIVDFSQV